MSTRTGDGQLSLSWITNRSMRVSPRARLVDDGAAEALRRKLEAIEWRPQNGFLKDQVIERDELTSVRAPRAA
jgi:hypothetical protein